MIINLLSKTPGFTKIINLHNKAYDFTGKPCVQASLVALKIGFSCMGLPSATIQKRRMLQIVAAIWPVSH